MKITIRKSHGNDSPIVVLIDGQQKNYRDATLILTGVSCEGDGIFSARSDIFYCKKTKKIFNWLWPLDLNVIPFSRFEEEILSRINWVRSWVRELQEEEIIFDVEDL